MAQRRDRLAKLREEYGHPGRLFLHCDGGFKFRSYASVLEEALLDLQEAKAPSAGPEEEVDDAEKIRRLKEAISILMDMVYRILDGLNLPEEEKAPTRAALAEVEQDIEEL